MVCNVYFSFDYTRDLYRVNQIRQVDSIAAHAAAGFSVATVWEEAQCHGDAQIRAMIDAALLETTVSVICIGTNTAMRPWLQHEVTESTRRGNTVIAVKISHLAGADRLPSPVAAIPHLLNVLGIPVYTYKNADSFAAWIERAACAGH